jgi:hypothetical protein
MSRTSALQEKGHRATGKSLCNARRPSPIAVTATAGSSFHRLFDALLPGSAAVTSHEPSSS